MNLLFNISTGFVDNTSLFVKYRASVGEEKTWCNIYGNRYFHSIVNCQLINVIRLIAGLFESEEIAAYIENRM